MRTLRLERLLLAALLPACAALAACSDDDRSGAADMAVAPDMAFRPDLITPPDFALAMGGKIQFVIDSITMPDSDLPGGRFLYDLDGKGPKNRMVEVVNILDNFSGSRPQPAIDSAILAGDVLELLQLSTTDGTAMNDPRFGLACWIGATKPGNDPADNFTGDAEIDLAKTGQVQDNALQGELVAGAANTLRMPLGRFPVRFPLAVGAKSIQVTLHAAHAQFEVKSTGGKFRLTDGQLHGGVSAMDIDQKILPAVAELMQDTVDADPSSGNAMTLLSMFDTDKNGTITADELRANILVAGLLSPDVDLFDASGNLAPGSDGEKDAISFGVGFTAVGAQFPAP